MYTWHAFKPRSVFLLGASVLAGGLFAACGSDGGGGTFSAASGGSRPTGGNTSAGGAGMAVGGAKTTSGGSGSGGMAGSSNASGAAGMGNASGASGAGAGGGQNVAGMAGAALTGGSSSGGASGSAATGGSSAGGALTCGGTATACSAFDTMQAACGSQTGCAMDGLCVAAASGAAGAANATCRDTHRTASSCTGDSNCEWRLPCRPKASNTVCASNKNSGSCNGVDGCVWAVDQCVQFFSVCAIAGTNETKCTNQTNGKCQWVPDYIGCNGTPNACGTFPNNTCSGQAGCSVQ